MSILSETTLAIDQDTVALALEWLEATGLAAGWPVRTRFKLRLCLDETLTNITMYGYANAPQPPGDRRVRLRLSEEGHQLVLEVTDNGSAFDPTARTPRPLDASLEDARIGGHGLRLMLHYLDDMRYERREGWNRLQLFASLDPA